MLSVQFKSENGSVNHDMDRLKHSPFLQSLALLAVIFRLDRAVNSGGGDNNEAEASLSWIVTYVDSIRAMGALSRELFSSYNGRNGHKILQRLMAR